MARKGFDGFFVKVKKNPRHTITEEFKMSFPRERIEALRDLTDVALALEPNNEKAQAMNDLCNEFLYDYKTEDTFKEMLGEDLLKEVKAKMMPVAPVDQFNQTAKELAQGIINHCESTGVVLTVDALNRTIDNNVTTFGADDVRGADVAYELGNTFELLDGNMEEYMNFKCAESLMNGLN